MFKKVLIFFLCFFICLPVFSLAEHAKFEGHEIPVDIVINDTMINADAFLENGSTFVSVRGFCEALGATVLWNQAESSVTVTKNDITLTLYADKGYGVHWGNVIYCTVPYYNGSVYAPVKTLTDIFGYALQWDGYYYRALVTAPDVTAVPQNCINHFYNTDDILWLARITQVECGNDIFENQLATANVIVNRVKSSQFPNSVYDVVFDRRGGAVQFPPAFTNKIYLTPKASCIIAAKCALNGDNNIGPCLFFLSKKLDSGSWVARNKTYYTSVGGHMFYY